MYKAIFFSVLLSLLFGCATPARVDQMVVTDADVVTSKPVPDALQTSIVVSSVSGGEDTNPLWVSEIGNTEFKQALEKSLERYGLLSALRSAGKYELMVILKEVKQPLFGLDLTVTTVVNYRLLDKASRKEIFYQDITAAHTATFSDSAMAFHRLKLANEGSAKKNIAEFIENLRNLSLD